MKRIQSSIEKFYKKKEYYLVLSIEELEDLIAKAILRGSKDNVQSKIATVVLNLKECKNKQYDGQLNLIDEVYNDN